MKLVCCLVFAICQLFALGSEDATPEPGYSSVPFSGLAVWQEKGEIGMLPGRGCGQPDDSGELENMVKIQ